jgi:hypothetical protein
MTDSERPAWLARHLDRLPPELEPARDLWPGIAQRLARPERSTWRHAAMAASLLLSAGLALFAWQTLRIAQSERAAVEAMVAELIDPYEQIQADQAARWLAVRAALHPDLAVTLQDDMTALNHARTTLSTALATAPADPALHSLLRQVVARESELIETGARLAGNAI